MAISVVPGKKVGQVELGASRQTIITNLGQPSSTKTNNATGLRTDKYLGSQPANEPRRFLNIIYNQESKAIQIEYNSPDFATSNGISTHSTLTQFRSKHPNPIVSLFAYEEEGGGGFGLQIYDDARAGIAWVIGTQDNIVPDEFLPESLRVHFVNCAVLPDPGGEAAEPFKEVAA